MGLAGPTQADCGLLDHNPSRVSGLAGWPHKKVNSSSFLPGASIQSDLELPFVISRFWAHACGSLSTYKGWIMVLDISNLQTRDIGKESRRCRSFKLLQWRFILAIELSFLWSVIWVSSLRSNVFLLFSGNS